MISNNTVLGVSNVKIQFCFISYLIYQLFRYSIYNKK